MELHPEEEKQLFKNKEKIKVDDFNTAALDDLLGGSDPVQRSETVKQTHIEVEEEVEEGDEWDPFAHKQQNTYSSSMPVQVPASTAQKAGGASNNIFGDDDDDMWGGSQPSGKQQSVKEQRQTLDDILGGDDGGDFGASASKGRSQTMAGPSTEFDLLKNLYNTASAMNNQPMYNNQPSNYYNTGMPSAGYGMGDNGMGGMDYNNQYAGGGMGYNQNYGGGMGYDQQPQYYNTSYGAGGGYTGGYGGGYGTTPGYGGAGGAGYGTGYNTGYGYSGDMQNTGFNTAAPKGPNKNGSNFDPFS